MTCGAGRACRSGECLASASLPQVARCQVVPDLVYTRVGRSATVEVLAFGASGEPLVPTQGPTWTAGAPVSVAPQGLRAEVSGVTVAAASLGARATFGSVSCTAQVVVLGAAATGTVVVQAFDDSTHRPVSGVSVIVSDSTGAVIAQATSGQTGVATLTLGSTPPATVTVSAFHADYGALTVAGLPSAGLAPLAFPLRRNERNRRLGVAPTFRDAGTTGQVVAGMVAVSDHGTFNAYSPDSLLGPVVERRVRFGTTIDEVVPLGAGPVIDFTGSTSGAGQPLAIGRPGWCALGDGGADETAIAGGTCGQRTFWSMLAPLTFADLSPVLGTAGQSSLNVFARSDLARKAFSHVRRSQSFTASVLPTVTDGGLIFAPDAGPWAVTSVPVLDQPLAFDFSVGLPALPATRTARANIASAVVWTEVPREGLVVLGAGFGSDQAPPFDGVVDPRTTDTGRVIDAGVVAVRSAPLHSGLEGGRLFLSVAAHVSGVDGGLDREGAVSVVQRELSALTFDQTGVALASTSFPAYPEGLTWRAATRRLAIASTPALPLARVVFTDARAQTWDVISDAATLVQGVVLPSVPTGLDDRTRQSALPDSNRSALLMQTFAARTRSSATATSVRALVELDGDDLDGLRQSLTAFAAIPLPAPTVQVVEPRFTFVARGSTIELGLSEAFRLGTTASHDGVVRVSFLDTAAQPVAGCGAAVVFSTRSGRGATGTIPAGCPTSTPIRLRADLLDPTSQPLSPAVSAEVTVQLF